MVLAERSTELVTTSRGFTFECDPADGVITKAIRASGEWEEGVALAIEKYLEPGWTFLDLGAHVGYFSVLAASRGNPVIAVEADPHYVDLLERNAAQNGRTNIDVRNVAVSDSVGRGSLKLDERFADNLGAQYLVDGDGPIRTDTLAGILGTERPQFIKADIEGMEYRVLKAALEILDAAEVVVIEIGREMCERYNTTIEAVLRLLNDHGFGVTFINGTPLDDRVYLMQGDHYTNLLARKAEPVRPLPTRLSATVILCAWRNLLAETAECMLQLRDKGWAYMIKRGDALITRSRSIAVSQWYRQTTDDVFLMIDDDVVFESTGAESVVRLAREKRTIVCAAYPVKDGTHLACRRYPGQEITFAPDSPPVEIEYAATGFMAVHRDVITAMIAARTPEGTAHFPLCGKGDGAFWPFFDTFAITGSDGNSDYLSEDYAFCEVAKRLGFPSWLDTTVNLFHMGFYPYCVQNMKNVVNTEVEA